MINLKGVVNLTSNISGDIKNPSINLELVVDSVSAYIEATEQHLKNTTLKLSMNDSTIDCSGRFHLAR